MKTLILAMAVAAGISVAEAKESALFLLGDWHITRGEAASWVAPEAQSKLNTTIFVGQRVTFGKGRVVGPTVLGCRGARYEREAVPAEGLFQGNLAAPAQAAAERLGFAKGPVPTIHLSCETGLFDYHQVNGKTVLVALDNVIWTLERGRKVGVRAIPPETTPAGAVQSLYADHFAHDMAFTPESVARKRKWLAPDLVRLITAYFAKPDKPDEVPAIDGDPFTDSQEYPTGFALGVPMIERDQATVAVELAMEPKKRLVSVRLHHKRDRWLVTDLVYEDGGTLRQLLKADK